MAADALFWDGFDDYGPVGFPLIAAGVENPRSTLFASAFTSQWTWNAVIGQSTADDLTAALVSGLTPAGLALQVSGAAASYTGAVGISKTLPASYARIIFGANLMIPRTHFGYSQALVFGDSASDQLAICINESGLIELRRGSGTDAAVHDGTLLATSTQSVTTGVAFNLKGDLTFHGTAGKAKIWINDALTSLDLTGLNTANTANNSANSLRVMVNEIFSGGGYPANALVIDDLWLQMFTASGGVDVAPVGALMVETQFPSGDDAVAFTVGAAILGADYSATSATSAPGANTLFLRRFTPEAAGTLNSVCVLPQASSAVAKFKAVAYADAAGAPGALLSSGVEVVGAVAGSVLAGDLVTPQALVAGTSVWIGFITDASIALAQTDSGVLGRSIANTYGSGAPGTAGAMTANRPSWVLFGLVGGVTAAWSVVDESPAVGDRSYMASANVGDQDLMSFPPLSSTPTTIYGVAVKISVRKDAAGARTVDLRTKSAATTASGSNTGLSPAITYGSLVSYFTLDPDTAAAWNASGVNLAKHGYKIAS